MCWCALIRIRLCGGLVGAYRPILIAIACMYLVYDKVRLIGLCMNSAKVSMYHLLLKFRSSLSEIELLGQHGTMLPPDMMGLTDEQVQIKSPSYVYMYINCCVDIHVLI